MEDHFVQQVYYNKGPFYNDLSYTSWMDLKYSETMVDEVMSYRAAH